MKLLKLTYLRLDYQLQRFFFYTKRLNVAVNLTATSDLACKVIKESRTKASFETIVLTDEPKVFLTKGLNCVTSQTTA